MSTETPFKVGQVYPTRDGQAEIKVIGFLDIPESPDNGIFVTQCVKGKGLSWVFTYHADGRLRRPDYMFDVSCIDLLPTPIPQPPKRLSEWVPALPKLRS